MDGWVGLEANCSCTAVVLVVVTSIINAPTPCSGFFLISLGNLRPAGSTASGLSWPSGSCVVVDTADNEVVAVRGRMVAWVDETLASVSMCCLRWAESLCSRRSASSTSRRQRHFTTSVPQHQYHKRTLHSIVGETGRLRLWVKIYFWKCLLPSLFHVLSFSISFPSPLFLRLEVAAQTQLRDIGERRYHHHHHPFIRH